MNIVINIIVNVEKLYILNILDLFNFTINLDK